MVRNIRSKRRDLRHRRHRRNHLHVGGEGWTVSIDEVRTIPVDFGDTPNCLAVIGTATLDSLNDGLTSSGFSFPEVVLIQNGIELESFSISCDSSSLESEGLTRAVGAEITQGTTIKWFATFEANAETYDIVAIEETIYTSEGTTLTSPSTTETPDPVGNENGGPYPFGDSHSRSPGFGGEGWTVSIDEVRTIPVDFGDTPNCLAVIGTATLDSLNDGLTSSGFSFPEVVLIQNGIELESFSISCDSSSLESEGLTRAVGAEITQGTTIKWFATFEANAETYDIVAIEETIYTDG